MNKKIFKYNVYNTTLLNIVRIYMKNAHLSSI